MLEARRDGMGDSSLSGSLDSSESDEEDASAVDVSVLEGSEEGSEGGSEGGGLGGAGGAVHMRIV